MGEHLLIVGKVELTFDRKKLYW